LFKLIRCAPDTLRYEHQLKADEILAEIDVAMKRGVPAAELQRQLEEACKLKIRASEAAQQLAPYVHSKMPTLVVQPDQEAQQYVIRVPNAQPDGQAWSHAITDVKAITVEAPVNGKGQN
jgi:hypothetical protein